MTQVPQAAVISTTLSVPGHGIQYKATLVRLLNEDPKLSNDRLVRVKQTTRTSRSGEGEAVRVSQMVKNLDYSMMWFIRKVTLMV